MLRIDFNSLEKDITPEEVTDIMDKVLRTVDRLPSDMTEVIINENNLEFIISRENEDDYWEIESVTKNKDGNTYKNIKA